MTSAPSLRLCAALAVSATMLLTACSTDEAASGASETPTTAAATATATATATPTEDAGPITVTDAVGTELVFEEAPDAIVSLSPTATEMLFALGAGDRIVAADEYSDHPAEAPTTELSGFNTNIEAVAAFEPDVVVAMFDPGDMVAQFDELDIPVAMMPAAASLDDVWAQIEALGTMTDSEDAATVLVDQLQADIDAIVADTPVPDEPLAYYHEVDANLYSISSSTFLGQVYDLFGMENVADEAALEAGVDYPLLQSEAIVDANPAIIFVGGGTTPDDVAARPGWAEISAVAEGTIVALPDDIAARWGPRIVDFTQFVADTVVAAQ